jgi:hypothetical protein
VCVCVQILCTSILKVKVSQHFIILYFEVCLFCAQSSRTSFILWHKASSDTLEAFAAKISLVIIKLPPENILLASLTSLQFHIP